jgi:hypothetical protein
MTIRITAIRREGGSGHEHITRLWSSEDGTGNTWDGTLRATVVSWIEDKGVAAYVKDSYGNRADVEVREPKSGSKYLQTKADGVWTDNLLALPEK